MTHERDIDRLESGAHGAMGVVESGAGCARRDTERLGDLRRSIARVVVEHEDRPLLGRQPSEPAFELVTIGDGEKVIGSCRTVDRQDPQVGDPAALTRRVGQAAVDDETVQPRVEPVRIAESLQVTPGDHQSVLKGILGPVDVAQDPLRDREEPVHPNADQVDVCLPIPVPCRLHEIAIHLPRLSLRPTGAPSDHYG
jgi:hypothetical protein